MIYITGKKVQKWDILLIRNDRGVSIFEKLFYKLIRLWINFDYNHCAIIYEKDNIFYIVESQKNGFNITKTLDKFVEEQNKYHRGLKLIRPKLLYINDEYILEKRFNDLIDNNYCLNPFFKTQIIDYHNTNCFQSIMYLYNIKFNELCK